MLKSPFAPIDETEHADRRPAVEPTARWVRVRFAGQVIADSRDALLLTQYGRDQLPSLLLPSVAMCEWRYCSRPPMQTGTTKSAGGRCRLATRLRRTPRGLFFGRLRSWRRFAGMSHSPGARWTAGTKRKRRSSFTRAIPTNVSMSCRARATCAWRSMARSSPRRGGRTCCSKRRCRRATTFRAKTCAWSSSSRPA